MNIIARKHFLIASGAFAAATCSRRALASTPFSDISLNGEPLRTAFNRDADKVRILMLVSPT